MNKGTIKAAKGTIIESNNILKTLSLTLFLYISKPYPAKEAIIRDSTVVITAIFAEFHRDKEKFKSEKKISKVF